MFQTLGFVIVAITGDNFSGLCFVHLFSVNVKTTNDSNMSAATVYEIEVMICLQFFTTISFILIIVKRRHSTCGMFLILTIQAIMMIIFHNNVSLYLVISRAGA